MNTGPCRWEGTKQRASNGPTAPTRRVNTGLICSLRLARSAPKMPFWPPVLPCVTISFLLDQRENLFLLCPENRTATSLLGDFGSIGERCLWAWIPVLTPRLGWEPYCSTQTTQPDVVTLLEKPAYFGGYPGGCSVLTRKVPAASGFLWFPAQQTWFSALQTLITWREAGVNQLHPGKLRWGRERGRLGPSSPRSSPLALGLLCS